MTHPHQQRYCKCPACIPSCTGYALVQAFFGGDVEQTVAWYNARNPLLGNVTPNDMLRAGRAAKLLAFIQFQLGEN